MFWTSHGVLNDPSDLDLAPVGMLAGKPSLQFLEFCLQFHFSCRGQGHSQVWRQRRVVFVAEEGLWMDCPSAESSGFSSVRVCTFSEGTSRSIK